LVKEELGIRVNCLYLGYYVGKVLLSKHLPGPGPPPSNPKVKCPDNRTSPYTYISIVDVKNQG
jgi:hypothetical protein